jgi:hypothetical protein
VVDLLERAGVGVTKYFSSRDKKNKQLKLLMKLPSRYLIIDLVLSQK